MNELKFGLKKVFLKKTGKVLFENLEAVISQGDLVFLDGKNGTGKSSLFKIISQVDFSYLGVDGYVKLNNFDIFEYKDLTDLRSYRLSVSYLEQIDNIDGFEDYKLKDYLFLLNSNISKNILSGKLQELEILLNPGLSESRFKKLSSNIKMKDLSPGQLRFLNIYNALCVRDDRVLYLIDEPLNNLDDIFTSNYFKLLERLKELNKKAIVLIISHIDKEKVKYNKIINLK
jgi:ABC-type multidrug transport system ATPase subunit